MRCIHCGTDNPETVIFCQQCGRPFAGTLPHRGSSSVPPPALPMDRQLLMRTWRKESSLPAVSQHAHRSRHRQRWRLRWMVLALLMAGAGVAWVVANASPSTDAASQTLLTYCDALKGGEYPLAYEHWTSLARQQMSEADFAYYYQRRGKMSVCTVSNVSVNNATAEATMRYTFADGSVETAMVLLVMEQGTWKIQSQTP